MRFFVFTILFVSLSAHAGEFDWKISASWSPALEKKFSEFVAKMGESKCRSFNECVRSPVSNPFYAARTPAGRNFFADCADLPYALRMYFAWMEGLPFDYVAQPVLADPAQETNPDIRYSKFGNKPGRTRAISGSAVFNFSTEFTNLVNSVSTATYRMHYNFVTDFYPPSLDRANVRPGTVVYDASGHAAIIYRVGEDGRIFMMDAHPDNSLTRITFSQKFARSKIAHGAGFKNWRPELSQAPSESLPGFSAIQYAKEFRIGGNLVSYYDYVRAILSGGRLRYEPVVELKNMITEICYNVKDRVIAVDLALRSGIQNKPHPLKLPYNIYGTSGEWEEYSSPSRDARMKVAFVELRTEIERYVQGFEQGNPSVIYEPVASKYSKNCRSRTCFLAASLLSAYEETVLTPACTFQYVGSDGTPKKFGFTFVNQKLFALSFDPYHCAELRWGASGENLANCRDNPGKLAWYRAEQGLRNQTERTYDARMDYDVEGTAKLGLPNPPDVDLWTYLGRKLQ